MIKSILYKTINLILPKRKNAIFVTPLLNCQTDKYDLINYKSDTALSLLNEWMRYPSEKKYDVYLIIYDRSRIELYQKYVSDCKQLSFHFVPSYLCYTGMISKLVNFRNAMIRARCTKWFFEGAGDTDVNAAKSHHQISLGYFASCKSNYVFKEIRAAKIRKFSAKHRVTVFSNSHFDSMAKSAAFGVPMKDFLPFGMPRNDNFGHGMQSQKAKEWLESKKRTENTRVILYAPTFRDYEKKEQVQTRSIWGKDYDDNKINQFLREQDLIVVAKLHSWQNEKAISHDNPSIVLYEPNYDFSFYELMPEADAFITDYSSIGYDWLFTDKPIIYNLWDLDLYRRERGLAYEPYESVCAGEIVTKTDELIAAIDTAFKKDLYAEKRRIIKDIMFSVQDYSSGSKIIDHLTKAGK